MNIFYMIINNEIKSLNKMFKIYDKKYLIIFNNKKIILI